MKTLALAVWSLALWQQPAHAWGNEGHRLTGHIANAYLNEPTRQQLRILVGTDDLSQIATWMDDERESLNERLPGSAKWHYENRAACANSSATNPCSKGQCITKQIDRSTRALTNRSATNTQRAEAVRMLVHLLGDLHQPLHLIDNHDRGGNDVYVRLPREKKPQRLHAVWDTQFVRMNLRRESEGTYARTLATRFAKQRSAWQDGTIEQWATETYALALQNVYYPLPRFACRTHATTVTTLSTTYVDSARAVVASQLVKAGLRIAWILNEQLGAPTQTPIG